MDHEQMAHIAHENGYHDAEFDGIWMTDDLPCRCERCLREYADGFMSGQMALYEAFEAAREVVTA